MEDVVLIGFGGHARSMLDSITTSGKYNIVGYTEIHDCHNAYKYLGNDDQLEAIYSGGVSKAILGIGYVGKKDIRKELVEKIRAIGYSFPNVIDDSAIVAGNAIVGEGVFIGKRAIVNSGATIGNYCIINSGSIVEHDCEVGEYTHISVGAVICGEVRVGPGCMIGANSTILQGINVDNNCVVGAGAVVNRDIPSCRTAVGVPARLLD